MTEEIEGQVKFNVTPKKAIIVDALILGLLLCAFFAGYWYGQKSQYTETKNFFTEYIDSSCSCKYPLTEQNGRLTYEKDVSPVKPYWMP